MREAWTEERRARARTMYEDEGKTLQEIATALHSNLSRCADAIRAAGGTVRGAGPPRGSRNGSWKGGRTLDKDGYVLLQAPSHPHANSGGYVREHRLVMEQLLGRCLNPREVVHHRNSDHADNRPENLELYDSNGSHLAQELKGRRPNWTPEGQERLRESARRQSKR